MSCLSASPTSKIQEVCKNFVKCSFSAFMEILNDIIQWIDAREHQFIRTISNIPHTRTRSKQEGMEYGKGFPEESWHSLILQRNIVGYFYFLLYFFQKRKPILESAISNFFLFSKKNSAI